MIGFMTFIAVMSFTPGPNTILAMSEGQQKGFRRSLPFNLGILVGLLIIGGIISIGATLFQRYPLAVTLLKVIGAGYLLYLAYHMLISQPNDAATAVQHPFMTGTLLQATNIKCYLYFVTGMGTFAIAGIWGAVPLKFALMIIMGILGTLTWTLAGQLIQTFYRTHFRAVNIVVSLLLVFSAYDLWH